MCKIEKPIDKFSNSKYKKDGKIPQCKSCRSELGKKYRLTPQAKLLKKISARKSTTGFTQEYFDTKLSEQGNVCAICGTDTPGGRGDFHADHCHKTGQTRGVLCRKCNAGLGHFNDSVENIKKAIEYLEYYKAQLKDNK